MKQIQLTNKALYQISMRLNCTVSVTGSRRQLAAQLWLCNLVINIKDLIKVLMQIRTVPDAGRFLFVFTWIMLLPPIQTSANRRAARFAEASSAVVL